jgi:hypothetical protein
MELEVLRILQERSRFFWGMFPRRKGIGRVAAATRTDRTGRVDRWSAIPSSCCGRPRRKAREPGIMMREYLV